MSTQAAETVRLRVRSEIFQQRANKHGKLCLLAVAWDGLKICHDGHEYGAGEIFEVTPRESKRLLESGCVQLASDKPEAFMPVALDPHKKNVMSRGVSRKSEMPDAEDWKVA